MAILYVYGSAISCSRCLALVSASLNSLPGVTNVSADKSTDTLTVDYDAAVVDEAGIWRRIRSTGFYKERLYCIC